MPLKEREGGGVEREGEGETHRHVGLSLLWPRLKTLLYPTRTSGRIEIDLKRGDEEDEEDDFEDEDGEDEDDDDFGYNVDEYGVEGIDDRGDAYDGDGDVTFSTSWDH